MANYYPVIFDTARRTVEDAPSIFYHIFYVLLSILYRNFVLCHSNLSLFPIFFTAIDLSNKIECK